MDLDYFVKKWKNGQDLDAAQRLWDLRADEFNNHPRDNEKQKRLENILQLFTSRKVLHDNAEILDIGCGPGKYALAFAPKVKGVMGIDISPNMIQFARENAEKAQLDNTCFAAVPWETVDLAEYGWTKKFDLAFASMSPAISSSDSLLKMCEASKGYCFMSSFAQRQDELRDELYRMINGEKAADKWGRNIYYALNVLLLSGYYPEVTYHDAEFAHQWPLDKAVEIYSSQLDGENKATDAEVKKQIRRYLQNKFTGGVIRSQVRSKAAWIYWQV